MEVITKVACCSLIAGGGGVAGAYGIHRISKDETKEATDSENNQSPAQPAITANEETPAGQTQ